MMFSLELWLRLCLGGTFCKFLHCMKGNPLKLNLLLCSSLHEAWMHALQMKRRVPFFGAGVCKYGSALIGHNLATKRIILWWIFTS